MKRQRKVTRARPHRKGSAATLAEKLKKRTGLTPADVRRLVAVRADDPSSLL